MARSTSKAPAHSLALKRPKRASLAHAGVPDGRDDLAVRIWWSKQRTFASQVELGPSLDVASSVRSVMGSDDVREPLSPLVRKKFDRMESVDLLGVGGQFD